MNCYGCHVLQKALDCEEDIRLFIVSELLAGDPAQTLVNKHASHVWSKVHSRFSRLLLYDMLIRSTLGHGVDMDGACSTHIHLVIGMCFKPIEYLLIIRYRII